MKKKALKTCPKCKGEGKIIDPKLKEQKTLSREQEIYPFITCDKCHGKGDIIIEIETDE